MPRIISGTVSLLNTASGWITVIAPIVGGLFGGYHAIMKSKADDEMEIAKHSKMIKNAVVGTVLAMTITGTITFITGFYS